MTRAPLAAALLVAAASTSSLGCIERGYPLGTTGSVEIRVAIQTPLFAADLLEQGKPVGPRQAPFSTGVQLYLFDDAEAAYGAFVDVRVDPPEALTLYPQAGNDTCEPTEGSFRCTASEEGFGYFEARSETDWSGEARLIVSWAGANGSNNIQTIDILPAGLPSNATNFGMVVTGITQNPVTDRIRATFEVLECTVGPAMGEPLPKWRPGAVRARQAFIRATPPPNAPNVVENAPVVVESLNAEGQLSLSPECPDPTADPVTGRVSRLRMLLNSTGESPPFFLCFSDHGGTIPFTFSSGELSQLKVNAGQDLDSLQVVVDAEPRLLRVATLNPLVKIGDTVTFEVTAYNSDLVKIDMTVFAEVEDTTILQLSSDATITTTPEIGNAEESTVLTLAKAAGNTRLLVVPNLLSDPVCQSNQVTVEP